MNDEAAKAEPEKMPLTSMDIAQEKREQFKRCLAAAFPEIMAEDKIDFDQLKRVLGEWVEPDRERFGLNWPGKAACMKVIQAPSVGTLKPCKEESVDWDKTQNLFIEGDNLEVLKLLQKAYFGKVKMIYIDPPYNTGHEFIYPDKYAETLETYLEYTGQKDSEGRRFSTNTDTSGRYHSRWMNMMYSRLYLAKNLLREDGAIFISIDDNELHNLIALCNYIFGEENFRSNIVWQKRYTRSNNTVDFTEVVEHILVYAKTDLFEVNLLPRTDEADARYTNPDNDPRGVWKGASFLNPAPPERRPNLCYPVENPNTGEITHPNRNAWRRSKEAFESLKKQNRLYWGPDGKAPIPSIKMFLSEARGMTPINLWSHDYAGNTDEGTRDLENLLPNKIFDNPKPVKLMRRMIEHACTDDCVAMDFFSGTCVMAEAVLRYNKDMNTSIKFIMVQLPELISDDSEAARQGYRTISDIGRARLRKVSDELAARMGGDDGFRTFKLSKSNFRMWPGVRHDSSDADLLSEIQQHGDHVEREATSTDILFELLLKDGFPLTIPITHVEVASKQVFSVAEGALLICLEKELTQKLMDALAEMEPSRVICLDAGFKGNDQLKANAVQTFKARARNKETAIEFRTV